MSLPFSFSAAVIGVWARQRVSSLDDFLVMDRKLRTVWGVATLAATETGLITIIYFAEEAYKNGFVAIAIGVIAAFTMWLVGRTGFVISRLRALEIRTVPEYFEKRYGLGLRWIAGILIFATGVLNLGIFLQVEGRFLVTIMGLSWGSLPFMMGAMLFVVVLYTMLGGMYAVVLTDVVQFVFIMMSVVVMTYFAWIHADGIQGMFTAVKSHYGDEGLYPWKAARLRPLFLVWAFAYYISGWSSWQPVMQRVLSMQDVGMALRLFRISSLFMFFRAAIPMLWGIAALAVLSKTSGEFEPQTALANMLIRILPTGMIGCVTVGFLAASMSTYSSYLLSFSAIGIQDVVVPLVRRPLSESQRKNLTQVAILAVGVFIYTWGVCYQLPETVFRCIALTASLSYAGTITGLVGGLYWRKASKVGAYCAFGVSVVPPLLSMLSSIVPYAFATLGETGAGLLSFALAPIAMIVGSLLCPDDAKRERGLTMG